MQYYYLLGLQPRDVLQIATTILLLLLSILLYLQIILIVS